MIIARLTLGFVAALWANSALAIGSEFTVQATLDDNGVPANGSYDLNFQAQSLIGANIGPAVTIEDVVVTQGVFTVQLDLGTNVFSGSDRVLQIGVRPGASSGPFTPLSPDIPIQPSPYAQLSQSAQLADLASDVTDFAIDAIDIDTNAVTSEKIATDAVTNSKIAASAVGADQIATNAVGSAEIAPDAVGSAEIATGAVGSDAIGANAVGPDELQSNSVTLSKIDGANYTSPANLNTSINASTCGQFDLSVTGGFTPGDFVIGMPNSTFPANIVLSVGIVVSTNVVRMRFCNVGTTTQSLVNAQIRLISLR